jgi:hypothetical protein
MPVSDGRPGSRGEQKQAMCSEPEAFVMVAKRRAWFPIHPCQGMTGTRTLNCELAYGRAGAPAMGLLANLRRTFAAVTAVRPARHAGSLSGMRDEQCHETVEYRREPPNDHSRGARCAVRLLGQPVIAQRHNHTSDAGDGRGVAPLRRSLLLRRRTRRPKPCLTQSPAPRFRPGLSLQGIEKRW